MKNSLISDIPRTENSVQLFDISMTDTFGSDNLLFDSQLGEDVKLAYQSSNTSEVNKKYLKSYHKCLYALVKVLTKRMSLFY